MSLVFANDEITNYIVDVPRDVETDVVLHLQKYHVEAQSELGEDRFPGMVRVTRTGGDLDNEAQDKPQILIEVWHSTAPLSWELAIRIWAILSVANQRHELNDVELYDADIDVPRTLDDELAPELHRHQFIVGLTVPMTEITIPLEGEPL